MSPSAFAAVLGPVTGPVAPARGARADARAVGDKADFAAALNDGAADEAPAQPASANSPSNGVAGPVSPGGETETGELVSESLATASDGVMALPVAVLPVPETLANVASIEADASAGQAGNPVPALDRPADEVSAQAIGKPLAVSGDGDAVAGTGADKLAIDNAGQAAAEQAAADQPVAQQKVVAPPASNRAREVAALQSAVLTPVRPAKGAAPAGPATASGESADTAPGKGDEATVAPAAATPGELVRVRDVIDRAATRTGNGANAPEAEPSVAVSPKSVDPAATQPLSAKPAPSPADAVAQQVAPPISAEEPTTAPPIPAAPTSPEARAAEDAQSPGLSSLSRVAVETTTQIAAQIVRRLEGRSTRFEMALTPEGLGRVDISLDIEADGALRATLAFDNPVAATDLRGRADELRRQLLDAGFTLAEDALSFAERDPTAGQGGGFDRSSDRHNARAFGAASRLSVEADLSAQPARWINLSLTPAGVDMKV